MIKASLDDGEVVGKGKKAKKAKAKAKSQKVKRKQDDSDSLDGFIVDDDEGRKGKKGAKTARR
jgi:hypothetical protein